MGAPGYDVAAQHLLSEAGKVKALARDRTDLDIEARILLYVMTRGRASTALGPASASGRAAQCLAGPCPRRLRNTHAVQSMLLQRRVP